MRSKIVIINIVSSLILQLLVIIYGFLIPRLIIENYGSSINGLITSITQFLAYIALIESGFGPVVKNVLYKPIAKNNKTEIKKILKSSESFFRNISYIFIIYILFLCLFYPRIVNNQFDSLFTISLIIIIALSTFSEYYFGMTYKLYLQAKQKSYILSFIEIVMVILNTFSCLILIRLKSSIQLVKLVSTLIFMLRPIILNYYIKNKCNISLKNVEKGYKIKQKWDGMAQHIAAVIHSNTDVFVLTIFSNVLEISVYSIYYLVVNSVKKLIQSFLGGVDATFGDMIAKKEDINKKFKIYEIFYFTIITIIFSATLILIVPFVMIYTKSVTDVNYYRPIFAFLLVLSEFFWAIRLPYSKTTLAAGHFKETQKGAWLEAIINLLISIILVIKYGIVGVTIGTLVAMLIRTIEFMYHSTKYILNRSLWYTFKRLIVIFVQVLLILVIVNILNIEIANNYFSWIKNSIFVVIISTIIVLCSNLLIYNSEIKEMTNKLKSLILKKED